MSAKTTITESELTAIAKAARKTRPALTFEKFLRVALDKLGITVIPDLIPEPEGDVIVLDAAGDAWHLSNGMWDCSHGYLSRKWDTLLEEFGPVKIYRAEEQHD